jgi:hypothetical protein
MSTTTCAHCATDFPDRDKSARLIYQALAYWHDHEDPQDRPCLDELLELFAPPKPPTAEELAEALRTVIAPAPTDYVLIRDLLARYDATREG